MRLLPTCYTLKTTINLKHKQNNKLPKYLLSYNIYKTHFNKLSNHQKFPTKPKPCTRQHTSRDTIFITFGHFGSSRTKETKLPKTCKKHIYIQSAKTNKLTLNKIYNFLNRIYKLPPLLLGFPGNGAKN